MNSWISWSGVCLDCLGLVSTDYNRRDNYNFLMDSKWYSLNLCWVLWILGFPEMGFVWIIFVFCFSDYNCRVDRGDRVLEDTAACEEREWWGHLHWGASVCGHYKHVQRIFRAGSYNHEASCVLQAEGPSVSPCLGLYYSHFPPEDSHIHIGVYSVDGDNLLYHRICSWS